MNSENGSNPAIRAENKTALRIFAFAITFLLSAPTPAQEHAGQYEQADIEFGAQLYGSHCVACHGDNGDLLPTVNLRGGQFTHAANDRELAGVIRDGIAGTAMIATSYNEAEIAALVAYVRNIGTASLESVMIGNAGSGREIYEGKGDCSSCHQISGEGPRFAPDLTSIGATRTAATLQRTLLEPSEALLPINRQVRIVTDDGTVITGRRLNEDTFTVQLVDDREQLISLDKTTLREYTITTSSEMPAYGSILSDEERADVLAYLLTLTGVDE